MKKIQNLLLLSLISYGAAAQTNPVKNVIFNGKVSGDTKGFDKIYYFKNRSKPDSTNIVDGKFTITVPFEDTFIEAFYTGYKKGIGRGFRPTPVLIDQAGTINIDLKIEDGFEKAVITGSPTTVAYNSFLQRQDEVFVRVNNEIKKMYPSKGNMIASSGTASNQSVVEGGKKITHATPALGGSSGSSEESDKRSISRDSLTSLYFGNLLQEFITSHPNSIVGTYILNGVAKSVLTLDQIEKSYKLLSPEVKKSKDGQKIEAYLFGVKNAVSGKSVKNFVLNDNGGKPYNFESLKGKYVWVDFWASWCGPCKAAFPHMKEIYAKYKGKNFEMIGISTDDTKEPWLKAVDQFKNPWPQIWDNKAVASEFGVSAYPTSFLIGPDGKILIKEVGFSMDGSIVKKLQEIFN